MPDDQQAGDGHDYITRRLLEMCEQLAPSERAEDVKGWAYAVWESPNSLDRALEAVDLLRAIVRDLDS